MTGAEGMGDLGRAAALESYRQLLASGAMARMHALIVESLATHGPMTGTECFAAIERDHDTKLNYNTRTRFGELRTMGVIREQGRRLCTITHRKVIVWELGDGRKPEPKAAQPTRQDDLAYAAAKVRTIELMRSALWTLVAGEARKRRARGSLWSRVGRLCGMGSTTAAALCRELGFDPETGATLRERGWESAE